MQRKKVASLIAMFLLMVLASEAGAVATQSQTPQTAPVATEPEAEAKPKPEAPRSVKVEPGARDAEIRSRLESILTATGWFVEPHVKVHQGVVFLTGIAETDDYKQWATTLAQNTQDVVAVVNKLRVEKESVWNFRPALAGLRDLWVEMLHSLPYLATGLIILLATWLAARLAHRVSHRFVDRRVTVPLLREVIARAIALVVFVVGLYIVLKVSGLTRLALTVIGGTGILGLVIGIAFRDITENFLASVFLSIQRPFRVGDLVEIVNVLGYVERLTVRTTVITTLKGNQMQIPNATVYKNTICNYTSNPNRRDDFLIGIGYDMPLAKAQAAALQVLSSHPAVLAEPEPWVLVDHVESSGVYLRVYFWIDGSQHNWLKVRSSVIRLVKLALQEAGIALPAPAPPLGVLSRKPVFEGDGRPTEQRQGEARAATEPLDSNGEPISTEAEGGLHSDAKQIERQSRQEPPGDKGANLLKTAARSTSLMLRQSFAFWFDVP